MSKERHHCYWCGGKYYRKFLRQFFDGKVIRWVCAEGTACYKTSAEKIIEGISPRPGVSTKVDIPGLIRRNVYAGPNYMEMKEEN